MQTHSAFVWFAMPDNHAPTDIDRCQAAGLLAHNQQSRFEPKPSGRRQGRRDYFGLGSEATDSHGVVRDSPSLPDLRVPDWYRHEPDVSGA